MSYESLDEQDKLMAQLVCAVTTGYVMNPQHDNKTVEELAEVVIDTASELRDAFNAWRTT